MVIIKLFAVLLIVAGLFFAEPSGVAVDPPQLNVFISPGEVEQTTARTRVRVSFAGDVMAHMPQIRGAWRDEKGTYDFSQCFTEVAPYLERSDVAIANLETTLAGEDVGYSGYPRFNAPDELAEGLKDSGFQILGHANNHVMDKGVEGLIRTHRVIRDMGMKVAGTRLSEEEDTVVYFKSKGVTFGLVTGTYGTNGLYPPPGKEFMYNGLSPERLVDDVERAGKNADAVICFLHWGTEYMEEPNTNQKELTRMLWDAGADAVIGHHPHVVQKDVFENGKLAAYSLGNFISNQIGAKRRAGIIYSVDFEKNKRTGELSIIGAEYVPVFTVRVSRDGRRPHQLWILDKDFSHDYSWSSEDLRLARQGYEYVTSRINYATENSLLEEVN